LQNSSYADDNPKIDSGKLASESDNQVLKQVF